jgi:hypothetical protein
MSRDALRRERAETRLVTDRDGVVRVAATGARVPAMTGQHSTRCADDFHPTDFHSAAGAEKANTDLLREHGYDRDRAADVAARAAINTQESLERAHSSGGKPRGNTGRPARDVDLITPWDWSDRPRSEPEPSDPPDPTLGLVHPSGA